MEWRDEGLVIGVRRHGESSVIAELMTRAHGRHMGLVRSGRSRSMQPVLQAGNHVEAHWRARIEEHLGQYALEASRLRTAELMSSPQALHGVGHISALLRLLPEREPHENLYEMATLIVEHLQERDVAPALVVRFELAVLVELGFGLDLSECAATGVREELIYVSPKSGRAVSRGAGAPYAERLLPLPEFLTCEQVTTKAPRDDLREAFRMTGYFLERDIFAARGLAMPDARAAFIACL
jgi:DNA repair protein RecO (recombination protein O)